MSVYILNKPHLLYTVWKTEMEVDMTEMVNLSFVPALMQQQTPCLQGQLFKLIRLLSCKQTAECFWDSTHKSIESARGQVNQTAEDHL